jgi:hypothetical protein
MCRETIKNQTACQVESYFGDKKVKKKNRIKRFARAVARRRREGKKRKVDAATVCRQR